MAQSIPLVEFALDPLMAQSIPLVEFALDPLTDLNFLKVSFGQRWIKANLNLSRTSPVRWTEAKRRDLPNGHYEGPIDFFFQSF